MSHLHTVNNPGQLADCLAFIKQGDALLFIEDGVYCILSKDIDAVPKSIPIYSLGTDIEARGLASMAIGRVENISYVGFVKLCCDYEKIINWF